MFRDKDQELERLAQALLEEEDEEAVEEADESFLADSDDEEEREEIPYPRDYRAYNTDTTDTDLDAYSEEVHRGKRGLSGLAIFAWLLTLAIVLVFMYLYLRYGGWL